jgi:hypothetical protein
VLLPPSCFPHQIVYERYYPVEVKHDYIPGKYSVDLIVSYREGIKTSLTRELDYFYVDMMNVIERNDSYEIINLSPEPTPILVFSEDLMKIITIEGGSYVKIKRKRNYL